MTGEHASPDGVCALCDGKLRLGEATIPFVRGERIFAIRQVPALICSDCSEAYMTGRVVDEIQALLRRLDDMGAQVLVAKYRAA